MTSHTTFMAVTASLCLASAASGEEVVRRIEWQTLAAANALKSGTVIETGDAGAAGLRLIHAGPEPATLPLATIEQPPVRTAVYAVRGLVRYDRVAAGSYLEMWRDLAGGAFFSRTLDAAGPLGRLEGSSDWRPFVLPFFNREGGTPPRRLVLNLVLAGSGTVDIGPLELVQFAAGEDPLDGSGAWWSDRQAGMIGAFVGSAVGILGALVGWLVSAGRAKTFVLGTLRSLGWLGVAALLLGVVAFFSGQRYAVYYPPALLGVICAALGFSLPPSVARRYEELELRRMRALDA